MHGFSRVPIVSGVLMVAEETEATDQVSDRVADRILARLMARINGRLPVDRIRSYRDWPSGVELVGFAAGAATFGIGLVLVIKDKAAGWGLIAGSLAICGWAFRHWRQEQPIPEASAIDIEGAE